MADMKSAMKAKAEGKLALNVIRMARAHIRQAEIDNGHCLLYTSRNMECSKHLKWSWPAVNW